jgi:hypothetical protein
MAQTLRGTRYSENKAGKEKKRKKENIESCHNCIWVILLFAFCLTVTPPALLGRALDLYFPSVLVLSRGADAHTNATKEVNM